MKKEKGVYAAYISVCIIWGSTYLAMRVAASNFPPELFAGIRFLIAGSIVAVFALITKKEFPRNFPDLIKASLPGVMMLAGCNGLVMWAEQWVHSGIASLLLSTTPLFVAVIEVLIFRDGKMGLIGWACLITGFGGIAMLVVSGAGLGSIDIPGASLIMISALLWSFGSIYQKKVRFSGDIASHIGLQMIAAGITLTLVGTFTGEIPKVHFNSDILLSLAYLVLFGSVIGYSSNLFVLSKWPASKAITSSYVNPVVAVILGALFLNERINPAMIICMAFTLGSVVMLHLVKYGVIRQKENPPPVILKGDLSGEFD